MNIFSFFSGAGFLDLGFELHGNYNIVFVNEFHEPFNYIYRYSRQRMGLEVPRYGHHVEDITEYTDGLHAEKLNQLLGLVEESNVFIFSFSASWIRLLIRFYLHWLPICP